MTDTVKHMWDQVEKARADGTFSSEHAAVPAQEATGSWEAKPPHSGWRLIAPEHLDDYRAKGWEVRPRTPAEGEALAPYLDAALRHADGLSAQLSKPDWTPRRAHIEQARNTIRNLVEKIRGQS